MTHTMPPAAHGPWAPVRLTAGALAAVLVLAGCGGGDGDGGDDGNAESEEASVDLGYFPLVHTITAVNADEEGIFAAAGLEVELHQTGGGAESIPPLIAGELDIVYGNYASAILAAQQGLPVQIVAGNDVGASDHAIMVGPDSELEDASDLEGATVAVNNLENIGTVAVRAIAEEEGLDPSAIDFVEMPYPDMQAALEQGEVDAIWQVEPFVAGALEAGSVVLFELFSGPVEDMPVAGWFTTEEFAQENPEVVEAFRGAMAESSEQVQDDRDMLVEVVPTYTEVPAEVVAEVEMPRWEAEPDTERLQTMVDLMETYEIISEPFDIEDMIAE